MNPYTYEAHRAGTFRVRCEGQIVGTVRKQKGGRWMFRDSNGNTGTGKSRGEAVWQVQEGCAPF